MNEKVKVGRREEILHTCKNVTLFLSYDRTSMCGYGQRSKIQTPPTRAVSYELRAAGKRYVRITVFSNSIRCVLGLPKYILQPFADGQFDIGRCIRHCGGEKCDAIQLKPSSFAYKYPKSYH